MNEETECLEDKNGNKYHVLKNSTLDLTDRSIQERCDILKKINNKYYYKNKLIHKKEGPAIEEFGNKYWYKNGLKHREDGPALINFNGDKEWYQNGVIHREDGPAIEYHNGDKYWYQNGIRHRGNGPAVEYHNGVKEYYINGIKILEEKFYLEKELRESIINNNISKKNKI